MEDMNEEAIQRIVESRLRGEGDMSAVGTENEKLYRLVFQELSTVDIKPKPDLADLVVREIQEKLDMKEALCYKLAITAVILTGIFVLYVGATLVNSALVNQLTLLLKESRVTMLFVIGVWIMIHIADLLLQQRRIKTMV